MKKADNKAQKRSIRRVIKQLFNSLIKRQSLDCQEELAKIIEMLREIEAAIDIIAREIARQSKQGE